MRQGKNCGSPRPERLLSVLQDLKHQTEGVLQLGEQEEVEVRLFLIRTVILCVEKANRSAVKQDQLRGCRTGERQGNLPESLKFLDMPGRSAACLAECLFSCALLIEVTAMCVF